MALTVSEAVSALDKAAAANPGKVPAVNGRLVVTQDDGRSASGRGPLFRRTRPILLGNLNQADQAHKFVIQFSGEQRGVVVGLDLSAIASQVSGPRKGIWGRVISIFQRGRPQTRSQGYRGNLGTLGPQHEPIAFTIDFSEERIGKTLTGRLPAGVAAYFTSPATWELTLEDTTLFDDEIL